MRKVLYVTCEDLSKAGMQVNFRNLRIEDLNTAAFDESVKSDKVIFSCDGRDFVLKDR